MAWEHASWRSQATDALRLTELRAHMDEVNEAINRDMAADSRSVNHSSLVTLLANLEKQESKLEALVGTLSASSSVVRSSFTRGRCT